MRIPLKWALPAALAAVTALPALAFAADQPPAAQTRHELALQRADDGVEWPMYIVTVDEGRDPAAVARMHGVRPVHVYRSALNGFSARLSPTRAAALKATPGVTSVEPDGQVTATGPVGTAGPF